MVTSDVTTSALFRESQFVSRLHSRKVCCWFPNHKVVYAGFNGRWSWCGPGGIVFSSVALLAYILTMFIGLLFDKDTLPGRFTATCLLIPYDLVRFVQQSLGVTYISAICTLAYLLKDHLSIILT